MADLGRPGALLGPFWCPPGALLAALGRLLGRSWRLLGPSWGLLGPPEQLLGLILASRGALFVAFGVSIFERPWENTKTLIFVDSTALFKVF